MNTVFLVLVIVATGNTSSSITIVRFKNTSGGLISDYGLSSNIPTSNELLAIEYVGPLNEGGLVDGTTYFTLEKENSTTCHIKRWELNDPLNQLDLKQTITKTTSAGIYYDANSAKAIYSVQGNRLLTEYCLNRGIPYQNIGKIIAPNVHFN